jgi:four helix bundle protein
MHNFRKLDVYAKGLEVVGDVYKSSKRFPKEELFGLTSQLRRAVTSIVLNIAEGSGCDSNKEFLKFLSYALRSKHEVTACLDIALKLGYTNKEAIKELQSDLEEISSMIIGLGRSLRKRV